LTPDPTFFSTERRKIRTTICTEREIKNAAGKREGIPKGKDTIQ